MIPDEQAPLPTPRRGRLTRTAGWLGVAFGAVHCVVAPLDIRSRWSQVASEGWWNTFTLDTPATLAEFERSETFWLTLGSFGAPVLALGCFILWSERHHQRVPGWLGWLLLSWGVPFVIVLPASPGWVIPLVGALVVLGDRRPRRTATPRPTRPASLAQA
ncbi:DUF6463 family protein [Nocardioides sp.]|uniref:DUF6463 family protein n=1 Tax=Nocardioides sp. TaxID=35761 RepID=UPI0027368883|nr:DUF6463 family protein [Nocardioides sp.]MDP3894760.1 DUF6463 family protein [Nocardioides sp.]